MYGTSEYNNNLTSLSNDYGSTKGYNDYNTLIAQKLPPSVPSMNFPVILEQSNIFGYDALTRGGDGTNYFNVKTAYGTNNCNPSYFVAKCPQNKFIRTFLPGPKEYVSPSACPVESELVSEGYSPDALSMVKNLGLVFFYDKNCEHSKNTYQAFVNAIGAENFHKYVDMRNIAESKNEQELTNLGGYAVPFLFARRTNNSVTGFMPIEKSLQKLSHTPKPSSSLAERIKDLKIVVYTMEGCHFCEKLKQMLIHFLDFVEFKIGTDPRIAREIEGVRGFPFIKSHKTGKTKMGLPSSVEELVKHLE